MAIGTLIFTLFFSGRPMAQTVLPGPVSAFQVPPGLEATGGPAGAPPPHASESPANGHDGAEQTERRRWTGNGIDDKQAFLDDLRKTVLDEADIRVERRMKEMWARGNKMLKQLEQESQLQTVNFQAELAGVRKKQEILEQEHKQLESVVAGMMHQFSMLGALISSSATNAAAQAAPPTSNVSQGLLAGTPKCPTAPGSTASTSASGDAATTTSPLQDSPPEQIASGSFPPLPTVPDFPFSPVISAAATPLSLAEALGSLTPKPSETSKTSTTPSSSSGMSQTASDGPAPAAAGYEKVFSFTLRKADGTDLGLNVSHHEKDKVLRVEGVRPEGAVEAWNRQCIGSTSADKAVRPGDRIISVNGVIYDPTKMLEECRDRQLLKLTVVRGQAPLSAAAQAPAASAVPKATTLRADASEFVPGGAPGLAAEEGPKEEDAKGTVDETEKEPAAI